MSDTESNRIELHDIAKQKVNERFAELLMRVIPPTPERLATSDDLSLLRADVGTEMAGLRTEMAELGSQLRGEMAELRMELRGEMAELRTDMAELRMELRGEMAELRTDMADLRASVLSQIHDEITRQTRMIVLSLVGSVTALAIANTLTLTLAT